MMEFPTSLSIESPSDDVIEAIYERFWRYAGTYNVNSTWYYYICDEVGSAILHSDAPNTLLYPFIHISSTPSGPVMTPYSLLIVPNALDADTIATRDMVSFLDNPKERHARLVAWNRLARVDSDAENDITESTLTNILKSEAFEYKNQLNEITSALPTFPNTFSQTTSVTMAPPLAVFIDESDPCRIRHVTGGLTDSRFRITSSTSEADILWFSDPISDASYYSISEDSTARTKPYVNQFPYEGAFVLKDNLAREIARHIGNPAWGLLSYDLQIQYPMFMGEYIQRKEANESNVWIIKPAISAHSSGHVITPHASLIPHLLNTNAARIAMEYITQPLLLRERRFDMRFVVLLRQVQPVELYVYDVFWTRLANEPAANHRQYSNKQSAYTAMHLINDDVLSTYPDYKTVIAELESTYSINWNREILPKIHTLLKDLFFRVTSKHNMKCSNSRAIYGCDIMMDGLQPKLLEVTFMPANNAVMECFEKQYDSYVNDVFGCLFFGETSNITRLL